MPTVPATVGSKLTGNRARQNNVTRNEVVQPLASRIPAIFMPARR